MKVYSDVLGSVNTNCYYIVNEDSKECIIIDPAGEFERIKARIEKLGVIPVAVMLTHGHFDHILATDKLREEYRLTVYASKDEKDILESRELNLSSLFGFSYKTYADEYLDNGKELEIAGLKVFTIATPGHTKGGMCYYFSEYDMVFSGDTLFFQSVGRTDFPTGSMSVLRRSIQEKLMILPENTIVYPGHGDETSIRYEKENNPYL